MARSEVHDQVVRLMPASLAIALAVLLISTGCGSDPEQTGIAIWPAAFDTWDAPDRQGVGRGTVHNMSEARVHCGCIRYPYFGLDDPWPIEFQVARGASKEVTVDRKSARCWCRDVDGTVMREWFWDLP